MGATTIIYSKAFKTVEQPVFTVVTPLYNRKKTVMRTIHSVEAQSFSNWEYIIVDDGSTDNPDELILNYLDKTSHSVRYIKKENGGVHTARNCAYKAARGEYIVNIDSDDEMRQNALEVFYNAFLRMPSSGRINVREVVARCQFPDGKVSGGEFPENINSISWEEARMLNRETKGEHFGCYVARILKNNLFPEPQGVTFVRESILWDKLARKYTSYYINDVLRIYHIEGDDHLSKIKTKSIQNCKNYMWISMYMLNDWETYGINRNRLKELIKYLLMHHVIVLEGKDHQFLRNNKLQNLMDRITYLLLYIPMYPLAVIYKKKCVK